MPRYFTLGEARQLLPAVNRALREAIDAKRSLTDAEREWRATLQRITLTGGMSLDRGAAAQSREVRESSTSTLKRVLEKLDEIGCVVKDLDVGLIDFPARYRGKEVYLCWRLGEPDIDFWHPVEEGFAGRRAIDEDFLRECG
jgi:hypothetical protein